MSIMLKLNIVKDKIGVICVDNKKMIIKKIINIVLDILIVLLGIILLGILFDVVSMSVTVAKEEEFHAKASKRVFGAKTAIKLIRNSEKVSSMCADVIGDICGVLSGAVGAILTMKITETMGLEFDIQFVISAIVASLTVGGKAAGKYIAKANSTKIVSGVSKIVNVFSFKKDK